MSMQNGYFILYFEANKFVCHKLTNVEKYKIEFQYYPLLLDTYFVLRV